MQQYMIIDEEGYGDVIFYGTYDECDDEVDRLCELNMVPAYFYNVVKNKG